MLDRSITVAKNDNEGAPATRPSFIEMLKSLRPVSGLECVRALQHEGFVVHSSVAGRIELRRGDLRVDVPLANPLEPTVLSAILQKAGIATARFRELLEE
jgi:hypothetical protein